MTNELLKITAVEYLNTALFVEGLKLRGEGKWFELSLDNPAECARKIIEGRADIGLVPVAQIPIISPKFIFGEYCIGASGPVRTVKLFSHKPLNQLQSVILDPHSRTSVKLLKVLCDKFWKIELNFSEGTSGFEFQEHDYNTGVLVIGDKVFATEEKYTYSYDLAEEWIKYTNKDFVFAAWVSRIDLADQMIRNFNNALKYGLDHQDEILGVWESRIKFDHINIREYLTKNISYSFDEKKRAGLKLFLELAGFNSVPLNYYF